MPVAGRRTGRPRAGRRILTRGRRILTWWWNVASVGESITVDESSQRFTPLAVNEPSERIASFALAQPPQCVTSSVAIGRLAPIHTLDWHTPIDAVWITSIGWNAPLHGESTDSIATE
jgi:hypothetical protein